MSLEFYSKLSDFVGIVGVILVLTAYFLLNTNKMSSQSINYLLFNFIGAWCILFSLFFTWNLASVIIEIAWILISLIGFFRVWKKRT